jgi:peptidoglycan-N-acetylglucosamine deacetylase
MLRITTSWDDGHPLDLRVAGLLAKYNLRGTFYVPLENSRPTMTPGQVRELSATFEIGAHTVHHQVLTRLDDAHAWSEISQSKARLEDMIGKACNVFCFPSGKFRPAHAEFVAKAGFLGARTVELLSFALPIAENGTVLMPTTIQAHPHSAMTYIRNGAKRFRLPAFENLLNGYSSHWERFAITLLQRAYEQAGIFHLWGHSWEIEERQQWAALEHLFQAIAQMNLPMVPVTNSELCCRVQ